MKKVIFTLFAGALLFSSCSKKEWTCTCTLTAAGVTAYGGGSTSTQLYIPNATKSEAQTICIGQAVSDSSAIYYTCSI